MQYVRHRLDHDAAGPRQVLHASAVVVEGSVTRPRLVEDEHVARVRFGIDVAGGVAPGLFGTAVPVPHRPRGTHRGIHHSDRQQARRSNLRDTRSHQHDQGRKADEQEALEEDQFPDREHQGDGDQARKAAQDERLVPVCERASAATQCQAKSADRERQPGGVGEQEEIAQPLPPVRGKEGQHVVNLQQAWRGTQLICPWSRVIMYQAAGATRAASNPRP